MTNDFLLNIQSAYPSLTRAEKKVADFTLRNPKNVRFMSISDLAEECHVGLTSVFRFCKTMHLHGYQEFKMQLSLSMNSNEEEEESEVLPSDVTRRDSVEEAAKKLLQSHINALMESNTLVNPQSVRIAAEMINAADQVRFYGMGGSNLTAMEGMYKFLHIMPNVYCLSDTHMQIMAASTLNQNDVAIFISHSGESKEIVEMAKRAKKVGAKIICITHYVKSSLAVEANATLLCGGFELPLQEGALSAKIAQLYVLDLLYTEVYRKKFEYSNQINKKVSTSILDKIY